MTKYLSTSRPCFTLPKQGIFLPNGTDDPLPYYYKPLIGKIYCARIEQALALLTPPYKSILELGYGSGILLPTLCKMSSSVSGIDHNTDPKQLNVILAKMGIDCTLIRGDIANNYFQDESFDLIVAISIFEHIADLTPVLERINILLRPKGHLLVGMPRVDLFMDKAFRFIGYNNINDHHITDYKQCRFAAKKHFNLIHTTRLPNYFPTSLSLYFNMLFEKK